MAETKELTLDELDAAFGSTEVKIDKEANAFGQPAPPDDGEYFAIAKLQDGKVRQGTDKNGNPFANINVQFKIINDDNFEGRVVFDNVTSISFGGGANKMYALAQAIGKGDQIATKGQVADLIKTVMNGLSEEPTVLITTKWVASEKIESDDGGKPKWKPIRSGQKNFPQTDSGYKHTFKLDNGTEVSAQAKIVGIELPE